MTDDAPQRPMPDVTDLKTYDVPDPIPTRGSFLRSLGGVLLGAVGAVGFLNATAAAHYFSVMENHDEYDWNTETARELISLLPPAEVLDRVLAMSNPRAKGALHQVLASTADDSHVPAITAYLESLNSYSMDEQAAGALESLSKFTPEVAGPALLALVLDGEADERISVAVRSALESYPPKPLQERVLAVADPAQRGRWHRVLASTGDPTQIDAIFAYVQTETSTSGRFDAEAKSLLAFGEAGTDKLKEALHSDHRPTVNLAAEALSQVNLAFLIDYTRTALSEYEKGIWEDGGLREAYMIKQAHERSDVETQITPAQLTTANATIRAFAMKAFLTMEMLKAMKPIPDNEGIDFCFVHGLSSFSEEVAEYCAATLQQRLTPEKLIDVMFVYIAKKDEFQTREVDVYEGMLLATGVTGATRIVANLDRLLKEQNGDPGTVFWIYKKMAFAVLAKTGSKGAIPTLELYRKDTDSYLHTTSSSVLGVRKVEVFYRDEVAKAINAIQSSGR